MENWNSRRTMMLAGAAVSTSDLAISQSAGEVLTAGSVIDSGVCRTILGARTEP
jgi:hypothetical protein